MSGFDSKPKSVLGFVLLIVGAGLLWFGNAQSEGPPDNYTGSFLMLIGVFVLPVAVGVLIATFKPSSSGEDQ